MENKELGNVMFHNMGVVWVVNNYGFGDMQEIGAIALRLGHIDSAGNINYKELEGVA